MVRLETRTRRRRLRVCNIPLSEQKKQVLSDFVHAKMEWPNSYWPKTESEATESEDLDEGWSEIIPSSTAQPKQQNNTAKLNDSTSFLDSTKNFLTSSKLSLMTSFYNFYQRGLS